MRVWVGPDDQKIIGAYLANLRQGQDVTQVELARRLEKPQSFVSDYERGQRRVDFLEFVLICRALGCDPKTNGAELLDLAVRAATDSRRT